MRVFCVDCKFYQSNGTEGSYHSNTGTCKRYPPIQDITISYSKSPTVSHNDWCGEWVNRKAHTRENFNTALIKYLVENGFKIGDESKDNITVGKVKNDKE